MSGTFRSSGQIWVRVLCLRFSEVFAAQAGLHALAVVGGGLVRGGRCASLRTRSQVTT